MIVRHHIRIFRITPKQYSVICWCTDTLSCKSEEVAVDAAEKHSVAKHHKKGAAIDLMDKDRNIYRSIGWCGDLDCKAHPSIPKRSKFATADEDDPKCTRCGVRASDHNDQEVRCYTMTLILS